MHRYNVKVLKNNFGKFHLKLDIPMDMAIFSTIDDGGPTMDLEMCKISIRMY